MPSEIGQHIHVTPPEKSQQTQYYKHCCQLWQIKWLKVGSLIKLFVTIKGSNERIGYKEEECQDEGDEGWRRAKYPHLVWFWETINYIWINFGWQENYKFEGEPGGERGEDLGQGGAYCPQNTIVRRSCCCCWPRKIIFLKINGSSFNIDKWEVFMKQETYSSILLAWQPKADSIPVYSTHEPRSFCPGVPHVAYTLYGGTIPLRV